MKNVLYCGPFDTHGVFKGGIHTIVNEVAAYVRTHTIFSSHFFCFNTCPIRRKKTSQGRLNFQNLKNSYYLKKGIIRDIKEKNISTVYFNSSNGFPLLKDLLILSAVKKKTKVRVMLHIHFADFEKVVKKGFAWLFIKKMNELDKIVFLSRNTMNFFVNAGIDSKKVRLLYNYQSISTRIDYERMAKQLTEPISLIFLGSLNERKGIVDLLTALTRVRRSFVLNICGEYTDERTKQICERIMKSFKNGNIVFNGYVEGDQKINLLKNSSVLVLPSYSEGLPLTLLEGMACGCYLISTKVGAIPEIFDARNGSFIRPGDVDALTSEVERIDESLFDNVSKHNIEDSKKYSLEGYVNCTFEILDGD